MDPRLLAPGDHPCLPRMHKGSGLAVVGAVGRRGQEVVGVGAAGVAGAGEVAGEGICAVLIPEAEV